MQLSFQRGRLVANPFIKRFEFGPNINIIPKTSAAYERRPEDEKNRDHILRAYRNFLRDAVYFLYEYNRLGDAQHWYRYMAEKFPTDRVINGDPDSRPRRFPSIATLCLASRRTSMARRATVSRE